MVKSLASLPVLFLAVISVPAGDGLPQPEAVDCRRLSASASAPSHLRDSHRRPPLWQQVDAALARLVPRLQGQECTYRFTDLFKGLDDDDLVPLTNRLLSVAPGASLEGVVIYDRTGAEMGRFERSVASDLKPALTPFHTFFAFSYRTPAGALMSTDRRLLEGDALMKWADVKERVVVDTVDSDQPER